MKSQKPVSGPMESGREYIYSPDIGVIEYKHSTGETICNAKN
ncbi:MAG: hypothetical protein NTV54_02100 [Ignavibacteriales bacterium]|nr:hypothetical protein [Ignavibacteriales bacterium]